MNSKIVTKQKTNYSIQWIFRGWWNEPELTVIKGQIRMVIKLKRKILLAHWTIKKCITVLNKQEETIANGCLRIHHIRNWVGRLWSLSVLYQVGARIFSLSLNSVQNRPTVWWGNDAIHMVEVWTSHKKPVTNGNAGVS